MKITICGHAGLLVEAGRETILLDPILRSTPLGVGATVYQPGRQIDPDRLPPLTTLVVTHAHFDHFDRESLELLPRDLDVIIPRDPRIAALMRALGFSKLHVLAPWDAYQGRGVRVIVTPSTAPVVEDEFGVVFDSDDARMWHMSDAEVEPAIGERLRAELGDFDVVSAKYQPQARAHLNTMFSLGAELDKQELFSWLEAAAATEPRYVFPYAAGVVLDAEHRWMNQHIFPVTEDEVAALMGQRLRDPARSGVVRPGDVLTARAGVVRREPQAAAFVRHDQSVAIDTAWEPIAPAALRGVTADERGELAERLEGVLVGPFIQWVAQDLVARDTQLRRFVDYGARWQAVAHLGGGERLMYGIDFGERQLELCEGALPGANYFAHFSGYGLLRALRSNDLAARNLFTCAEVRLYEKIMHVREERFWAPPVHGRDLFLHHLPEPLATFLGTVTDGAVVRPAVTSSPRPAAAGEEAVR